MKARIQFEIPDSGDADRDKRKLIEALANLVDDWVKGKGIINIDFIETYENTKEDDSSFWITDTTIN